MVTLEGGEMSTQEVAEKVVELVLSASVVQGTRYAL